VLAIYVFKAGEPELKKAQSPAVTDAVISKGESPKQPSAPAAEIRSLESKRVPGEMSRPPEKQEVSPAPAARGQGAMAPPIRGKMKGSPEAEGRVDDERKERPSIPALSKPTPTVPPPEAASGGKKEGAESKPDERVISLGSTEKDAAKQKRMPSAGAVKTEAYPPAKDSLAKELKAPAAVAPPRAAVSKRAELIRMTVQVKDVKRAGSEIEDLLHQLGATRVEKESIQDAEVVTTDLQSEKIEEFIEKLKLKGDIKEKDLPLQYSKGETRIRVEVLRSR